jgi:hypothetical protein
MFCHVTQNWRGRPLISQEVIVQLIANTATQQGLRIRAQLDKRRNPAGIKVTDGELAQLNLKTHRFHGDWKYTIQPTKPKRRSR